MIAADYSRVPAKPVIDGEPGYEHITNGLRAPAPGVPLLDDWDARRFAYCAVFAGAAGHTYGCNEVYQFWAEGRQAPPWGASTDWREALGLPGSSHMKHLRAVVESRTGTPRIPDQSLVVNESGHTGGRIQAVRGSDGSYALAYTASGRPVAFRLGAISGELARAY